MKLPFGLSYFWDVFLPLGVAGVPAALFTLIGWLIGNLGQPGRAMPGWMIGTMIVLQTLGTVAMAVVALVRYGLGRQQVDAVFPEGPTQWRILSLFVGVCCLTLFDVLTNVGAMVLGGDAGAGMLILLGVPFYLAYLILIRLSLLGAVGARR